MLKVEEEEIGYKPDQLDPNDEIMQDDSSSGSD
jgi:hypothetical protein